MYNERALCIESVYLRRDAGALVCSEQRLQVAQHGNNVRSVLARRRPGALVECGNGENDIVAL